MAALIREATLDDLDDLLTLWFALRAELGRPPPDPEVHSARVAALRSYFLDQLGSGLRVWVAEQEGRLVACCALVLYRRPPTTSSLLGGEGYLLNMYTVPEWRRRGFGLEMVSAAVACARQAGAGRILLDASEMGRPMYEQAGFVQSLTAMHLDLR